MTKTKLECILSAFADALRAAREFEGATSPNPPVGCVILDKAGKQISIGAHKAAGLPHAEREAIANLDRGAEPHMAIVTLEPCAHFGRTPPCVDGLLEIGIKEIWIGAHDNNPRVAGGGAGKLKSAGVDVHFLRDFTDEKAQALHLDCQRLIAPFLHYMQTGRPFVTLKAAERAGKSMIPPKGQKTFTSETSLDFAHKLRRRVDAIITGSGTILADNPQFTIRRVMDFENKTRHLVILDRRARVSEAYIEAARERGFLPMIAQDAQQALRALGDLGVMEALLEAGPTLSSYFRENQLVNLDITISHDETHSKNADVIRARYLDRALNQDFFNGEADVFGNY